MHPQLKAIAADLDRARAELDALIRFPDPHWTRRPEPGAWSAAECVEHLNLTSEMMLQRMDEGFSEARARSGGAPARYRRDFAGLLLSLAVAPGGRLRTRTTSSFVPDADLDPVSVRSRFHEVQDDLLERLRSAEGLPLNAVRIHSPFDARVRYNLYSAFVVVSRHQLRHLLQAGRALATVTGRHED